MADVSCNALSSDYSYLLADEFCVVQGLANCCRIGLALSGDSLWGCYVEFTACTTLVKELKYGAKQAADATLSSPCRLLHLLCRLRLLML